MLETQLNDAQLKEILKACERDLLHLAVLQSRESDSQDQDFKSSVFRFVWLKLTENMRRQANYRTKGVSF